MSNLDRLIAELCPDGVEYVKLADACLSTNNIKWKDVGDSSFQYIDLTSVDRVEHRITETQTIDAISAPSRAQQIVKADDVIFATTRPTLWRFYTISAEYDEQICSTGFCVLRPDIETVIPRYIYHIIGTTEFKSYVEKNQKGASYPSITNTEVKAFQIPLPPLPVQREIVRILDNFTELTAELTTELTARKKQYNYYRDELLTFGDDVPIVALGEIATDIYRGSGIKREEVTETGTPCVRYGEIYTTYDIWFDTCVSYTQTGTKTFEYGDILFAITGESVEEIAKSCVYIGHDKCFAGGDIVVMKHNQNPKYVSYALSTAKAQAQKSKGKVKSKVVHSSIPAIKEITIPIPPLKEQERIVTILDCFDALTTDISSGLPAEILARQKQYEYYRDKLLMFS